MLKWYINLKKNICACATQIEGKYSLEDIFAPEQAVTSADIFIPQPVTSSQMVHHCLLP